MTILTRTPPLANTRLQYGDQAPQFGDLRLPETPGLRPVPVVVVIHGGFWRAQYDLEHIGHLCAALTDAGYATWSIEYRRVGQPGGGWPGTLKDVLQGASYVQQLAKRFDLDLQRVGVIGHSAGGPLALWLAGESALVHGVVSLAGVADLRRAAELQLGRGATQAFLGGEPTRVPRRYSAASPIERVPTGVRQVLVHGTDDDTVPLELSQRYCEAASAAGDEVELVTLPGTGHFELIDPLTDAWPVVLGAVAKVV